jgi:mRNA interferase MazF
MKQKDIYIVDLKPTIGNEQQGQRPAVIVSGNAMNDYFGVSIICPLTSSIKNYAGCTIVKKSRNNGLTADSEVLTFQIRTLSKKRFIKKIGKITDEVLQQIFAGLSDVLRY